MGTLSKAYGGIGGFVATDAHIAKILRFGCSAFGFTSTLPPDQAAALLEAIDMVRDEPERRQRLWDNQRYFVRRMTEAGFTLLSTQTPIVPLHVGDEKQCARLAATLQEEDPRRRDHAARGWGRPEPPALYDERQPHHGGYRSRCRCSPAVALQAVALTAAAGRGRRRVAKRLSEKLTPKGRLSTGILIR